MRFYRFWKPYGVLSKFTDAEGRPTLADYIHIPNIYAAGRLDLDSEGLLLLTDSGALSHRLTDPRFAHPRTYWAQVERIPDDAALQRLREGVELSDGGKTWRTRPAQVELLAAPPILPERPVPIRYRKNVPTAWLQLTITEGRNRQVRRMTAAVGCPTLRLVRWAIGTITLEGLEPGMLLPLSRADRASLQARW
jgi:23S rRNA pseudouridine2457 synthase